MSDTDTTIEKLVHAWLTLPEIAEMFGVEVTRVRQLLKDRQLLAVRRGENRSLQVPAAFIQNNATVKGLSGTITVLSDSGFSDDEMLEWLFTEDESLPGTPVEALRGNRKTEVRRRAQALAV
ncbi:DNA-binding protein [Yinghuangia sp. ASG 101]|uniref:Rv2175c family DNA-binding protein n=1 Tax=Yinghuangia sp. ASG 101 TaxID=2896848 RepID=UPI001E5C5FFD|nr:Rv2175c family DNA-binding protein [Yinghuangia sp. ASG 101]UGQ10015.1 DNA-binding protein [Yinghuangia sp. ASG 101]